MVIFDYRNIINYVFDAVNHRFATFYLLMSGHKKDPSPEFLSFAQAQLEILPSPARGEGSATPDVELTRPARLTSVWERICGRTGVNGGKFSSPDSEQMEPAKPSRLKGETL